MKKPAGEVRLVDGKRQATPEYRSWQMMKNRCYNPKARDYRYYGERGITVCKKWRESFACFLADMGRRPSPAHTLDRKNPARGYMPSNCRWATREEQARNRPYAATKTWLLAEQLGVKQATASHMINQVYAKDRGNLKWFELSPEREQVVRNFLRNKHVNAI
jgi:hypothetical protein